MNTVSIIPGHTDPFYYQYLFEGKIKVETHYGTETALRRKIMLLRVDAIVDLCCQFKQVDDSIVDSRKNVQVYAEYRRRLQDYIEWALSNRDSLTGSVIQNGQIVATKYMLPIVGLIHDEQERKKELVSLSACVIATTIAAGE
jgi:hypothetical protein